MVDPNSGFIVDNGGIGKLISYSTLSYSDANLYTIEIIATNVCLTSSLSYTLDVQANCLTPNTLQPSILVDQEYTITTAAVVYTFDQFIVDPIYCEMTYTYQVTDSFAAGVVQSFDSDTRTITFYYDTDIALSGGSAIEFTDYTIEITG